MKMKSSKIFIILLMIIALVGYFSQRVTEDKITLSKIYDDPKRADKPEVYLSIYDELTTKPGQKTPDYPIGYRYKELEKSRSESPLLRTEESYEFTERGPANVPGRTRGLLVDPDDPEYKTWYAGGVGGGIWKTTDGGETWAEQTKNLPNIAISWIIMAPSDHSIMYAGTGEGWGGTSGFIKGNGIVKSTDGGNSWTPLLATLENTDFEIVNRIIVDPANANIILAATSTDRANNPDQASGIFKSIDGGETWLKKHTGESYVQQIIADPTDFNTQYAAVSGIGILKSMDAGETWTCSSTGLSISGRIEIAVSPVNSSRLYASSQGDLTGTGADLYFSSDYGETWSVAYNLDQPTANFLGGQGWYDNTILAHPFNLDEVYVGGVDFWKFKVDDTTVDLGNQFAGADEEGIEEFFELLGFNSGDVYGGKISVGDEDPDDLVSVEIRFGPDGAGGILTQMAHRFIIPDGFGSGVPDADYTYEGYVEVPFQVWDIKNNRQLMISFRDQQKDLVYDG